MNKIYLFLSLVIGGTLFAQEPPPKKSKADDQAIESITVHQPKALTKIAAEHIMKNFGRYNQFFHLICPDIKEVHLNPLLNEALKKHFNASTSKSYKKVTTPQLDSQCTFTSSGEHIVSIHNSNKNIQIYALADLLKEKRGLSRELSCFQGVNFCVNALKKGIYYIDFKGYLKEINIEETSSPKQSISLHEKKKSKYALPSDGEPFQEWDYKIVPHPHEGVFALSTLFHDNNFIHQNLYQLKMRDKPTLITTINDINHKLIQIYGLENNNTAFIHKDGSVVIMDNNYKKLREWTNEDKDCNFSSAINGDKTCIVLGNENGTLNIYNLIENTRITLSGPEPFSVLTFYDNDHIIAAHNNIKMIKDNKQLLLSLWNISKKIRVATALQKETYLCNTLDVSPDKKHVLLGMGQYDVAVRPIDSFNFEVETIDPEMIYKDPKAYVDLHKKDTITAQEKIAFINTYCKK